MLKRYKDKGLKICVWINPYVAQGTVFFREGLKKGYFLMRADGLGVKQVDNWQPGMAVIDFTNPEAVIWYQEKLKELLDMGVDCFKSDFGERIPVDVTYANGADAWGMHNYYTLLYNQTVFELLKREKGEKEAVLFARSATVGGQRFPVHWGGDCTGTYESMAESLRGGLSFMLSGFSYWSMISVDLNGQPMPMYTKDGCNSGFFPLTADYMAPRATGCHGCSTKNLWKCAESLRNSN